MKKLRTHYDNLQVKENASLEVIKGAYKHLSQKHHPDKCHDNKDYCEKVIKIINSAYKVLSDSELRKEHDNWIKRERAKQEEVKKSRPETVQKNNKSNNFEFDNQSSTETKKEQSRNCLTCGSLNDTKGNFCHKCGSVLNKPTTKEVASTKHSFHTNNNNNSIVDDENNSGQGKVDRYPDGVKGWCWGALFLPLIWAIGNKTKKGVVVGILCFIPWLGLFFWLYLSSEGRKWAWESNRWDSVEHFNLVQKKWSLWGSIIPLLLIIVFASSIKNNGRDVDLFSEAKTAMSQGNHDKGVPMMLNLAQQEHVEAQYELGEYYWHEREYDKSYNWINRSASHNFYKSYCRLSVFYAEGISVDKNIPKALSLLNTGLQKKANQAFCEKIKSIYKSEGYLQEGLNTSSTSFNTRKVTYSTCIHPGLPPGSDNRVLMIQGRCPSGYLTTQEYKR